MRALCLPEPRLTADLPLVQEVQRDCFPSGPTFTLLPANSCRVPLLGCHVLKVSLSLSKVNISNANVEGHSRRRRLTETQLPSTQLSDTCRGRHSRCAVAKRRPDPIGSQQGSSQMENASSRAHGSALSWQRPLCRGNSAPPPALSLISSFIASGASEERAHNSPAAPPTQNVLNLDVEGTPQQQDCGRGDGYPFTGMKRYKGTSTKHPGTDGHKRI